MDGFRKGGPAGGIHPTLYYLPLSLAISHLRLMDHLTHPHPPTLTQTLSPPPPPAQNFSAPSQPISTPLSTPLSTGTPHRIIRPSDPDSLGPFNKAYYNSWFESVRKTVFFGDKKVCFSELFLPPMPGVPWIWGDWSVPSECASKASSPLYQSFNVFLRHRWVDTFGRDSVQFPDTGRT